MIHFKKEMQEDDDRIAVQQVPETWEFEKLALAGHLAEGTTDFTLSIRQATVAIERGRGARFISIEANDAENWTVAENYIRQTNQGRGRMDFGFFGKSGYPDCAKVYVPFGYQGAIKIVLLNRSALHIDGLNLGSLDVTARGHGKVTIGQVHTSGQLTLHCEQNGVITAELVSCRSLSAEKSADCTGDGVSIKRLLVTAGARDQAGTPMELRA